MGGRYTMIIIKSTLLLCLNHGKQIQTGSLRLMMVQEQPRQKAVLAGEFVMIRVANANVSRVMQVSIARSKTPLRCNSKAPKYPRNKVSMKTRGLHLEKSSL